MKISISATTSVCLALAISGLRAEETISADQPDDVIVITAHREPVSVSDVGSSLSIVERDNIEHRQSVFATEILQDLPGLAVSRSGTFGSATSVRVRGAEANQVMVMIDGIKANDIASGDEFNFGNLTTFDVDRIEVVRGPQSALWGSDAMAGVINVVTRRASEPLGVGGYLEAGSFETVNGGVRIGAARGRGHANLSTSYLETDGTNISRLGDEKDGYDNWTTTLTAGFDPTDALGFDFTARHTDARNQFDESAFGLPVDADRITDSAQSYAQGLAALGLFGGAWDQKLRLTWADTDNDTFYDGTWYSSAGGEKLGIYYQSDFSLTRNAEGDDTNAVTLAIDHEKEDYSQRGIVQPWGDPNRDESLDNTGYVAEFRSAPRASTDLSFAIRHDDNSDFRDVTTWRATGSYRFAGTATRIRGSAGTGQKRPTFTERFGFFTNFVGNPDLKPEKSEGWDAGIDQEFVNIRTTVSATYFNEKLEDEINGFAFDPGTGGFTAVNTDGRSRRKGVELAARAAIGAGFGMLASYTYTDASQPDATGNEVREIRRPRHMGALNLNYRFARDRANTNLNISYTGEQQDDDFSSFPATRATLDAYWLVNWTAQFALTDTVTLYGRVDNLLDEDYENVLGFAAPGIGAFVGARLQLSN